MKKLPLAFGVLINLGMLSADAYQLGKTCQIQASFHGNIMEILNFMDTNKDYLNRIISRCSTEVERKIIDNSDEDFLAQRTSDVSKLQIQKFIMDVEKVVVIVNSLSQENREYFLQTYAGQLYKDTGKLFRSIMSIDDWYIESLETLKAINDDPKLLEDLDISKFWSDFKIEKTTSSLGHIKDRIDYLRIKSILNRFKVE